MVDQKSLSQLASVTDRVSRKYNNRKNAELMPLIAELKKLTDEVLKKYGNANVKKTAVKKPLSAEEVILRNLKKSEGQKCRFVGTFSYDGRYLISKDR